MLPLIFCMSEASRLKSQGAVYAGRIFEGFGYAQGGSVNHPGCLNFHSGTAASHSTGREGRSGAKGEETPTPLNSGLENLSRVHHSTLTPAHQCCSHVFAASNMGKDDQFVEAYMQSLYPENHGCKSIACKRRLWSQHSMRAFELPDRGDSTLTFGVHLHH